MRCQDDQKLEKNRDEVLAQVSLVRLNDIELQHLIFPTGAIKTEYNKYETKNYCKQLRKHDPQNIYTIFINRVRLLHVN